MPPAKALFARIKGLWKRKGDPNVTRIRRRMALTALLYQRLPFIKFVLFLVGYLWMLAMPLLELSNRTYIDENALQPGQVHTSWNWGDVHRADQYLGLLEGIRDANATAEQRSKLIADELNKLGIAATTQRYEYKGITGTTYGSNAYAVLSSPRTPSTEAMVVSASWLSRTGDGDGTLNLRGVSTVIALASFLKRYSLWAKDIIFVIGDGYLEGTHAWLGAYHGTSQSNLYAEPLTLSSGVIWNAINIDYPGHSFSHLGIFFEGLNGRLPNQDLWNSVEVISRNTGGVPVLVYDHDYPGRTRLDRIFSWLPGAIGNREDARAYAYRAENILRHVGYQAPGRGSGVHGLFHQFRIDAITVFAVPATGPHGFHALGRIMESTLRTTNNLLERLHASFFFYIMTSPGSFLKIGSYLPSAVLVSVGMMFGGLGCWVDAAWIADHRDTPRSKMALIRRRRPVLKPIAILLSTHTLGVILFTIITQPSFLANQRSLSVFLFALLYTLPLAGILTFRPDATAPLSLLTKSFNLCIASTVISIVSLLNFSLGALLAIVLGLPLSLSSSSPSLAVRLIKYTAYITLAFGWLLFAPDNTRQALWSWDILRVWFAPFVCIIYSPLVLQAAISSLINS